MPEDNKPLAAIATASALTASMCCLPSVIWVLFAGICDIDDLRRERRRVVNTSLALFAVTVLGYLVWNYVVLEVVGIALGLPWEESAFWK